ncbi:hypothetical protein N8A98_14375 [Devosia neptuniae]|uniref:Uncharacterized protein n=1 Tax=Devosia neptuniae TaxID=191302 RepID=A0ABY6C898_9HYPH|nr:hypothetical protein [Devosia neptuniae]UXN68446.1 hypothetical protein N8A98_14375 [Devosia neptuniae]
MILSKGISHVGYNEAEQGMLSIPVDPREVKAITHEMPLGFVTVPKEAELLDISYPLFSKIVRAGIIPIQQPNLRTGPKAAGGSRIGSLCRAVHFASRRFGRDGCSPTAHQKVDEAEWSGSRPHPPSHTRDPFSSKRSQQTPLEVKSASKTKGPAAGLFFATEMIEPKHSERRTIIEPEWK